MSGRTRPRPPSPVPDRPQTDQNLIQNQRAPPTSPGRQEQLLLLLSSRLDSAKSNICFKKKNKQKEEKKRDFFVFFLFPPISSVWRGHPVTYGSAICQCLLWDGGQQPRRPTKQNLHSQLQLDLRRSSATSGAAGQLQTLFLLHLLFFWFPALAFVPELASFHSLAQSYANKFKRINRRLISRRSR